MPPLLYTQHLPRKNYTHHLTDWYLNEAGGVRRRGSVVVDEGLGLVVGGGVVVAALACLADEEVDELVRRGAYMRWCV
jgi:hypothetical protein